MRKIIIIFGLICFCVALRLAPHAPNVVPMTAFAVFTGYALRWRTSLYIAPFAVFLSDLVIGFYEWQVMVVVYLSYASMVLIARAFKAETSARRMMVATWISSLMFFVTTNGAVWLFSPWYEKSLFGLLQTYFNGLPFLRNSLIGDMGYGLLFYLGYALYQARAPVYGGLKRLLARSSITP